MKWVRLIIPLDVITDTMTVNNNMKDLCACNSLKFAWSVTATSARTDTSVILKDPHGCRLGVFGGSKGVITPLQYYGFTSMTS